MLNIDADTTRNTLAMPGLIEALRALFRTGCEVPARSVHAVTAPDGGNCGHVLIMPAWQPGGHLGVKTVNVFPRNGLEGLPGLFATYTLYDARTGRPLAQIDGGEITARRTAAASALAASYLAPRSSRHLLVVGTGRVASLLPEAYGAAFELQTISVWGRAGAKARELAADLCARGWNAQATEDLAAAAGEADIVSCATLSQEPLLRGAWLKPDSHLDLIGSFTPQMREADDDCLRQAALYVDTEEALVKSGDLVGPLARGVIQREDIRGSLADLVRGHCAGRDESTGRTVFKSVGTALEDLAAATLVYESVRAGLRP